VDVMVSDDNGIVIGCVWQRDTGGLFQSICEEYGWECKTTECDHGTQCQEIRRM